MFQKLKRPKLFAMSLRARIFAMLDALSVYPVTWLSGSPGIGKTVLMASYLEYKALPEIWCQLDEADTNPADLLRYLSAARNNALAETFEDLPATPSVPLAQDDLERSSRIFFRNFFHGLPRQCVIVFDDFHVLLESRACLRIIAIACEEVPDGMRIFISSRSEPPCELSRLSANRKMGLVDDRAMRFTPQETREFLLRNGESDENRIALLHAETEGWAAGLALTAGRCASTQTQNRYAVGLAVHDYFESQAWADATPDMQDYLLRTAMLPHVNRSMAEGVAIANAGKLFEFFCRNRLFTELVEGSEIAYRYFPLFRNFLEELAKKAMPPEEYQDAKHRAAIVLQENGDAAQAIALFLETRDWHLAAQAIRAQARVQFDSGQYLTLRNWIVALPRAVLSDSPWLLYWLGRCGMLEGDFALSRNFLSAYALMRKRNDRMGIALTLAGLIESCYLEWNDLARIDEWSTELERTAKQIGAFPSLDAELCVLKALVATCVFRQPWHAMLPVWVSRLTALLKDHHDWAGNVPAAQIENRPAEVNQMVSAATLLLHHFQISGEAEGVTRLAEQIKPALAHPALSPFNRALWLIDHALHHALQSNAEAAAETGREAVGAIRRNGLRVLEPMACVLELAGDTVCPDAAHRALNRLMQEPCRMRCIGAVWHHFHKALLFARQSQLAGAAQQIKVALDLATQFGVVSLRITFLKLMAEILSEQGEGHAARQYLQQARSCSPASAARYFDCRDQFLEAGCALAAEDADAAREALNTALMSARQEGYACLALWLPAAARLYQFALMHGIEVNYVQQVIRKYGLQCNSADTEKWPFPVKIYMLGRFDLFIEDVRFTSAGKAQRKPLDLLKCLIAQGGTQVGAAIVIQHLWPDSDGDAAQTTFDSTVLRLRRLLGRPDAILVSDGQITLNPKIVWVDVWAFERLIGEVEPSDPGTRESRPAIENVHASAFRLYHGHFLGQEEERPWMLAMRERLRSKWLRLITVAGAYWEAVEQWDKAADLYQRGLELDSLVEDLYRRLMHVHHRRGQYASALEVYRRCRMMLSVVLGIKPSAETEAISELLFAAQQPQDRKRRSSDKA